jgi:hypothetical protein
LGQKRSSAANGGISVPYVGAIVGGPKTDSAALSSAFGGKADVDQAARHFR